MLIITDCSGSMMPYGAEVFLWHMLKYNKKNVNQFAFFNDGETGSTEVGNAGGIHMIRIKDHRKIGSSLNYVNSIGTKNFAVGSADGINGSGGTYVAWNWKESASAGFDIVSFFQRVEDFKHKNLVDYKYENNDASGLKIYLETLNFFPSLSLLFSFIKTIKGFL